jgi:hypothetical protein
MNQLKCLTTFLLTCICLSAFLPACTNQPDTCEGSSTCIHGYLVIINNCSCTCENQWEGTQCDVCNLVDDDCNNGFVNGEDCRCDCDPGWCGPNCDQVILDCQNAGTWNEFTCSCDCPPGWAGAVCDSMI